MPLSRNTLVGTAIIAVCATGCVDPGKSFSNFDERVIDASKTVIDNACPGGVIPNITGELYLALSPSVAPEALLQLIVTSVIDGDVLSWTLQPLCTQPDNGCPLGQPIGDPFTLDSATVVDCGFTIDLVDVAIPGGANPISGGDIIGNLELLGGLQSDDLVCGIVNGTAEVGGAPIPIDNSSFGAIRIAPGTLGADLPEPVFECPPEPEPDAGVADGGIADAGTPDA